MRELGKEGSNMRDRERDRLEKKWNMSIKMSCQGTNRKKKKAQPLKTRRTKLLQFPFTHIMQYKRIRIHSSCSSRSSYSDSIIFSTASTITSSRGRGPSSSCRIFSRRSMNQGRACQGTAAFRNRIPYNWFKEHLLGTTYGKRMKVRYTCRRPMAHFDALYHQELIFRCKEWLTSM